MSASLPDIQDVEAYMKEKGLECRENYWSIAVCCRHPRNWDATAYCICVTREELKTLAQVLKSYTPDPTRFGVATPDSMPSQRRKLEVAPHDDGWTYRYSGLLNEDLQKLNLMTHDRTIYRQYRLTVCKIPVKIAEDWTGDFPTFTAPKHALEVCEKVQGVLLTTLQLMLVDARAAQRAKLLLDCRAACQQIVEAAYNETLQEQDRTA